LNGKVIGSCLPRHRGKEFAKFLNQLEKQVPPDLDVHIILDNYSTHKSATIQPWRKSRKHRHFYFHFTPNLKAEIPAEVKSSLNSFQQRYERFLGEYSQFAKALSESRPVLNGLPFWFSTPKPLS
jgi:transposase